MTNIVVLTGAGISPESGLPTFRDPDGLWEGHRVQDVNIETSDGPFDQSWQGSATQEVPPFGDHPIEEFGDPSRDAHT